MGSSDWWRWEDFSGPKEVISIPGWNGYLTTNATTPPLCLWGVAWCGRIWKVHLLSFAPLQASL